MTLKEAISKLTGVARDQQKQCEALIREALENNLTDESMITVKRTYEQKKQYVSGITYALSMLNECSQTGSIKEVINKINDKITAEKRLMNDSHPASDTYQRASERKFAYIDCKRMISDYCDMHHELPDELLKEVSDWVKNSENDMQSYSLNSFPYYYARGQRNAIVDVFDILKQYGYESKGYIPKE